MTSSQMTRMTSVVSQLETIHKALSAINNDAEFSVMLTLKEKGVSCDIYSSPEDVTLFGITPVSCRASLKKAEETLLSELREILSQLGVYNDKW